MHELLSGSINAGDGWMNLQVAQRLEVPANVKLTATPLLLDPQSKPIVLEQITFDDGSATFGSAPLLMPGIYTLMTGAGNVPIAVNVPADEADVQTIDDAAIKSALGGIDVTMADDELPQQSQAASATSDFGWNVMLMVLAFVGLEAFLAMRFGHYKRK
jgi:hypothetical protein